MQENIQTADHDQILNTLELKDYVRLAKKHKWIILPTMLVVLAIAGYISISTPPVFEATTLVMVEEENRTQQFIGIESGFEQMSMKNEIEILKSRSLSEMVIDSLLRSPHRDNLYTINSRIYEPKTLQLNTWFKKVFSLGIYNESPVSPSDPKKMLKNGKTQLFSNKFRKNLDISTIRDTRTLEISYKSPDPDEAAFIANIVVSVYKRLDRNWKNSEIIELSHFLEQQLNKVSRDLSLAENRIREFQEQENIMNLSDERHPILNQLANYETTYFSTLAEVNVIENQIIHMQSLLDSSEKSLVKDLQNTMDPRIKELRLHLAEQEAILVNTLKDVNMDFDHRAIQEIQDQIEYLKEQLTDETSKLVAAGITVQDPLSHSQDLVLKIVELNSEQIQLESKCKEYLKLIDQLNVEIKKLPSKTLTYARLTRERKVKEQLYILLSEKLEETKITEASQSAHIRIIDPAAPGIKVKPDIPKNLLLGLILGLGLGIGIAFLTEYMDQSLRSIESIQRLGVSVMGIIPQIGTKYGRYKKGGLFKKNQVNQNRNQNVNNFSERLITHLDPLNPVSEAYRSIRTNISYSMPDKEINSIMVSSPGPSEGKTTTAINLAVAFSQLGKKTLLVDTDLRKPIIHKVFNMERQPGISDFLVGINGHDDLLSIINKTEIENLHLITSGKLFPNPSELLGSKRMKDVIKRLGDEFDIVIFDSPPIIAVTDSRVFANDIDAMVLIVKSGQTDAHHLKRAVNMLQSVNAPMIGCILNGFTHRHSYYGDYDYYYEYYYSEHLKD